MANNNNKHIKVYRKHFSEPYRCEVCGAGMWDIHHIEYRSSFGDKRKDEQDHIDNLIGLCRTCHDLAHGPESHPRFLSKEYLKEIVSQR